LLALLATRVAVVGAAPLPPPVDAAITTDPARDAAHPAATYQVAIPSHDAVMFGVFYRAVGGDPHPTVLFLHGLPGFEQNGDLAQTLRRAGWNVLIFHYRGAWGSGGTFSFSNCIDDVHVALEYLPTPENVAKLGVDPHRLALANPQFRAGHDALIGPDGGIWVSATCEIDGRRLSGEPVFLDIWMPEAVAEWQR